MRGGSVRHRRAESDTGRSGRVELSGCVGTGLMLPEPVVTCLVTWACAGTVLGSAAYETKSTMLMHSICAWSARSDDALNEGSYSREPLVCGLPGEAEFFCERGHPRAVATLE
jgi:hypothetical protein